MYRSIFVGLLLGTLAGPVAQAQKAGPSIALARPAQDAGTDICEEAYQKGRSTGQAAPTDGSWRVGGFASGLVFSLVGVAGATVVASAVAAQPDSVPATVNSSCYRDGYERAAQTRRRSMSFKSALVGALVLPTVWIVRASTR